MTPAFFDLVRAVTTWDGSSAAALALRSQAAALAAAPPMAAGTRPPAGSEQVLLDLLKLYRKKEAVSLSEARRSNAILAPFLGDPALGPWPFGDPFGIDDDVAVGWLGVLAPGAVVDGQVREFATVMFGTRKRDTWVPAAAAIARFATRDDVCRETLLGWWRTSFPKGLLKGWPTGTLWAPERLAEGVARTEAQKAIGKTMVHRARHTLSAIARFVALGGDAPGFSVETLLSGGAPSDAADRSAFLVAIRALLEAGSPPGAIGDWLQKRLGPRPLDDQGEAELRGIVDALGPGDVANSLIQRLVRPSWQDSNAVEGPDLLWSWAETALWLKARGDEESLACMYGLAGPAARCLALRLGQEVAEVSADAGEALADILRAILDPVVWWSSTPRRRSVALVEARCLMARKDLSKVPFRTVLARAGGPTPVDPKKGPGIGAVGMVELPLLLAGRDIEPPAMLLRSLVLDEAAVLDLAQDESGFVANQVAVQLERLLRLRSPREQVQLLWAVLLRDPQEKVFLELHDALRSDSTPLHRLVRALQGLDATRGGDRERVLASYREVVECHQALIPADMWLIREVEDRLASSPPTHETLGERLEFLRVSVFGPDGESGLAGWREYLGLPVGPELRGALAGYVGATARCERALSLEPTAADAEVLRAAWGRLDACFGVFIWPHKLLIVRESYLPDHLASQLEERRAMQEREAAERKAEEERVAAELSVLRGDVSSRLAAGLAHQKEAEVLELMDTRLDLIVQEDEVVIDRLHRFLLGQLLFRRAMALQKAADRTGGRSLQTLTTFLTPLFPALASGVFLFLGSNGISFDEVYSAKAVAEHGYSAYLGLLLVSATGSCYALVHALGMPRLTLAWRRLLLAFVATWVVTGFVVAAVLGILWDTAVHQAQPALQWVLWTSASQFMGLFLSLVVQRMRLGEE